jgi:hypothetical protein
MERAPNFQSTSIEQRPQAHEEVALTLDQLIQLYNTLGSSPQITADTLRIANETLSFSRFEASLTDAEQASVILDKALDLYDALAKIKGNSRFVNNLKNGIRDSVLNGLARVVEKEEVITADTKRLYIELLEHFSLQVLSGDDDSEGLRRRIGALLPGVLDATNDEIAAELLPNDKKLTELILSLPKDDIVRRRFIETLDKMIRSDEETEKTDALQYLAYGYDHMRNLARIKIGEYLQKIAGVSEDDFFGKRYGGVKLQELRLGSLFANCRVLEEEMPGSVRRLVKDYGIKELYRYPEEVLLKQLEDEAVDQPYGVVMFARGDHNDAFDMQRLALTDLFEDTKGHHAIKIFEVDSSFQAARHFIRLGDRYTHKISFAVIGGHGSPQSISYTEFQQLGSRHFNSPGHKRVSDFFESTPTVVLVSCSTGAQGGIAEKLSDTFNATVIAPTVNTNLDKLHVRYEGERPIFEVKYTREGQAAVYESK